MTCCRCYRVSGIVQGVFFRASTQRVARELGLTGWVRNLSDGRVELIACGVPTKLEELEKWLWRGPQNARVDDVIANDIAPQEFETFDIH